jgi:hypothetical protein
MADAPAPETAPVAAIPTNITDVYESFDNMSLKEELLVSGTRGRAAGAERRRLRGPPRESGDTGGPTKARPPCAPDGHPAPPARIWVAAGVAPATGAAPRRPARSRRRRAR